MELTMMPRAIKISGPGPAPAGGYSLVELMVAMTIGLLVLAAVSTIFVTSKRSYSTQDRLARVQENARFAADFLVRGIRTAGFSSCNGNMQAVRVLAVGVTGDGDPDSDGQPTFLAINAAEGINNYDPDAPAAWSPSGAVAPAGIRSGTDALLVGLADPLEMVRVTAPMPDKTAPVTVAPADIDEFEVDDIVMVADCGNADVFKITGITGNDLEHAAGDNIDAALSTFYDQNAKILKFKTRIFYIRDDADPNNPGRTIPTLRVIESGVDQELVQGVENLQITYGIDTGALAAPPNPDGIPDIYLTAGAPGLQTAAQWAAVKSIRIGMLIRSIDDKDIDEDIRSSYDVNGTTVNIADGDRYQRRVFETTIQMRNM
jgi:type IV pilus assembly protein PilW